MMNDNAIALWCCFEKESFSDGTKEYHVVTSFNSEFAALDWVGEKPSTRVYVRVVINNLL